MKRLLVAASFVFVLFCCFSFQVVMATPLLHLPYFEGEAWWCSQGNNETCSECTHRPGSTIRYAWDFNWGNGNDDFGRAVAAPAGGEITVARWESSGWGNCVEIKYGEDSYGWLAHLEKIFVRKGEHVKASQIIGLCGNSGTSSAHIHYHTSESSRGSSVPSSFIRWGNPPGGNSSTTYPSQNSQLFNEAYNRNGGHGRMGPAIDGIHWYYDFNRQGQDCYIQRYDRGSFGPCAIVYDALGGAHSAYVIRSGFWGKWRNMGGPRSALGQVINDEYAYHGTARQDFQRGYLLWRDGNAEIHYYSNFGSASPGDGSDGGTQAMIDCYNKNGRAQFLGDATGRFTGRATVSRMRNKRGKEYDVQFFEGGVWGPSVIFYDRGNEGGKNEAYLLFKNLFNLFIDKFAPGKNGDFVGAPTSDPHSASDGPGIRQNLEDGYHMLEAVGQVRVYAGNGREIDGNNLYVPGSVNTHDEGEQSCDPTVHFSYPVPSGAQDCYMQVAWDPDFQNVVWQDWCGRASGDKAFSLGAGRVYYARVRIQASNGVVSYFGGISNGIQIGCTVPTYDEGVFSNDPVVHFSYPVLTGIEMIHMQVAVDGSFTQVVWETDAPPTGDRAFSGQDGKTYYARVKLMEDSHWGEYGKPSDGITIGMTFPCFDDGDTSGDQIFHLWYQAIPGIEAAYLQISTDPLFSPHLITWEGLMNGRDKGYEGQWGVTYYGRIKVYDYGSHWGGYGAVSDGQTPGRAPKCWDEGQFSSDAKFKMYFEILSGADSAMMQVATDSGFTSIFWQGEVAQIGVVEFMGSMGSTYYGRVMLYERYWTQWGQPSDGITLGVPSETDDTGDYSASNAVTFYYPKYVGPQKVQVKIATDREYRNVVGRHEGDMEGSFVFRDSVLGQKYYATTCYIEAGGEWGRWGRTSDGILVGLTPQTFDEGEISDDRMVKFTFDCPTGVENVFFEVARDSSFKEIVWQGWTNDTSGTFHYTGIPGDRYYGKAKFRDNLGQETLLGSPSDGITIKQERSPSGPIKPVVTISTNRRRIYRCGDDFSLNVNLVNSTTLGVKVDLYVILEINGNYWSWPSWRPVYLGQDFVTKNLSAGYDQAEQILQFEVPNSLGSLDAQFFAAICKKGTQDVISYDSCRVTFESNSGFGENLVQNSSFEHSFENGLYHWLFENHLGYGFVCGDCDVSTEGYCSMRVDQVKQSWENYMVQLKQVGIPLERNANYRLSFWARAELPRTMFVGIFDDLQTESQTLHRLVYLGTDWQKYLYNFRSVFDEGVHTRLAFILGDCPETVWVDDVQLCKIN